MHIRFHYTDMLHSLSTHANRQGSHISFIVCCLVVPLQISPPRIKLAASNFARRFIEVQGRESPIFVNFASQKHHKTRPARRHLHDVHNDYPLTPKHMIARRVDLGLACVDIRPSPKTGVLVIPSASFHAIFAAINLAPITGHDRTAEVQ